MNVGPQADGKIQQEFIDTLKKVGEWLQKNGESIYGTRGNIIASQDWGTVTAKGKKLFVHILKSPSEDFILLPKITQPVAAIQLYSSKQTLKFKQQPEGVFIYLNDLHLGDVDDIIEITVK
ncbi:MAG: alpha-L-fucosidase [Chitinophagaceae bacterium]